MADKIPSLKVSTGWIEVEIIGEPDVQLTFKGYAPIVPVKVLKSNLEYIWFISAKSIAEGLEPLRLQNNQRFSGIKIAVRKSGENKFEPYEIKGID